MTKAAKKMPAPGQSRNDVREWPLSFEDALARSGLTAEALLALVDKGRLWPLGRGSLCAPSPPRGMWSGLLTEPRNGTRQATMPAIRPDWVRLRLAGATWGQRLPEWQDLAVPGARVRLAHAEAIDVFGDTTWTIRRPEGEESFTVALLAPADGVDFTIGRGDLYFLRHEVKALAQKVKAPDEPMEVKRSTKSGRDEALLARANALLASGDENYWKEDKTPNLSTLARAVTFKPTMDGMKSWGKETTARRKLGELKTELLAEPPAPRRTRTALS